MDAQDFRSLQEAYLDVYDELDESAAGDVAARARKLANQKKRQTPERKKMYQDLEYKARYRDTYGDGDSYKRRSERTGTDRGISPRKSQERSTDYDIGGSTYTSSQKERLPKSKEKYRRQVATGVRDVSAQERKRLGVKGVSRYNVQPLQGVKDSYEYDLYDVILEYLLDEGYAETPEAALAIMGNMSEDWRESIVEGDNYDKNRQRAAKRAAERNEARKRGQTGNVPGIGYVSPRPERETYRDAAGVERHTSGARMPQK